MKVSRELSFGAVIFCALIAPSLANEVDDTGKAVQACYTTNAVFLGANTCEPPPVIVGVVLGACASEEQAYLAALRRSHPNDSDYSQDVLAKARAGMITRVENSARIKIQRCP
jgi:hypothetical protein